MKHFCLGVCLKYEKNTWSVLKIIYPYLFPDTLRLSFSFSTPCFIPNVGFLQCWHIYLYIIICKEIAKCRKVLSYRFYFIILIYLALNKLLLTNIWLLLHIFHSHSKSIRSAISSNLTKKCIFIIHNWKKNCTKKRIHWDLILKPPLKFMGENNFTSNIMHYLSICYLTSKDRLQSIKYQFTDCNNSQMCLYVCFKVNKHILWSCHFPAKVQLKSMICKAPF